MAVSRFERPSPETDGASHPFSLCGATFAARPSGALWWPDQRLLTVADLHLGKSERAARRGGPLLPPYECFETLARLEAEIDRLAPKTVICLGDSFDDAAAGRNLATPHRETLERLAAGRRWIWVAGNHDPAPLAFAGEHCDALRLPAPRGAILFRHAPREDAAPGEIAGHLHPKATLFARGRRLSRPCFLADARRALLPAFGAYTGGLDAADGAFDAFFARDATALLTGATVRRLTRDMLAAPHASPK